MVGLSVKEKCMLYTRLHVCTKIGMRCFVLICMMMAFFSCRDSKDRVDLSGRWEFTTDTALWENEISLPGSMASNHLGDDVTVSTPWTGGVADSSYYKSPVYEKYRRDGNIKVPFWLQPEKYYKGMAWYRRTVTIPQSWRDKQVTLFLERCHWETKVWIDGEEVGMQNSLAVPHRFDITDYITPGKHTILLCVDNSIKDIDPGINAHSISDHTQGNWNGVIGKMYLESVPKIHIERLEIYPDIDRNEVRVKTYVENMASLWSNMDLSVEVANKKVSQTVKLKQGPNVFESIVRLVDKVSLWDEFHPNLYDLKVCISDEDGAVFDVCEERFGFRDIRATDDQLTMNGRPLFLRGTLDCAAYPLTGYPPMDVVSWKKIFQIYKDYGLNHVRFHSWCPPEAAFVAADEIGLYLQVECSVWPSHSTKIGDGAPIDRFVWEESERIVREYGNHPSFCMLMHGNEPSGKNRERYLADFVSRWKKRDGRRLYCSAGGWPNLVENDFLSSMQPRIQVWRAGLNSIINSESPKSDYDWTGYTSKFHQPVVSHEVGQWCAYPNFKEIQKYTGVMKARNFEIFEETLADNGMIHLADSFLLASGKLQALCYKADIEAALRTKNLGGFQLLGLTDFPGQGTALVGVLDVFGDNKGYISPVEFRKFCNTVVPLLRVPKFVYTNRENIVGKVEVANYCGHVLNVHSSNWVLCDASGNEILTGEMKHEDIEQGNCIEIGRLDIPLSALSEPTALTLKIQVGEYENDWHLWCYPVSNYLDHSDIMMVDRIDERTEQALEGGKTVLLSIREGGLSSYYGGDIQIGFSSIFWNTAWAKGQPPYSLGILCDPHHPALRLFPTDYYSDYQWWDAMTYSHAIEVNKLGQNIIPLVRVIDDWFTNRPLALIFEAKVGKGRLLVSGIDFWKEMETRLEARQLLRSLRSYMSSPDFQPQQQVAIEKLKELVKSDKRY